MAKISCEVYKCEHNCDGGCRLGNVKVDGEKAKISEETACESFSEKNGSGCMSCTPSGCACGNTEIDCEAEKCRHNDGCKCTADRITVGGSEACSCRETKCRSFSPRQA